MKAALALNVQLLPETRGAVKAATAAMKVLAETMFDVIMCVFVYNE